MSVLSTSFECMVLQIRPLFLQRLLFLPRPHRQAGTTTTPSIDSISPPFLRHTSNAY